MNGQDLWIWIGTVACVLWVLWDARCWSWFVRRYHQLDHEGKWDDLERLVRGERLALRPWIRLILHFKAPGVRKALFAQFFFQRGKMEEALRFIESAARASRGKTVTRAEILRLQAIVLSELQRYDEAREVIGRIRDTGLSDYADHAESLLCFYLGRLDQSLALAERARRNPKTEVARHVSSLVHLHKGAYGPAVEVLLDPPRDVTTLYKEEDVARLERTPLGRSMLEGHRKQWAGIVEPLRYLIAGYAYLDQDNVTELRYTLEKAAGVLGGNPSLRIIEAELNACLCAKTGDAAGADRWLQQGAEILKTHLRRASVAEFHGYSGRVNLLLGRTDAAVADLERALQLAAHPLEKHAKRYWLAQAYEARGDKDKAVELDRAVAADGFASRYSKASPPAPSEPPRAS